VVANYCGREWWSRTTVGGSGVVANYCGREWWSRTTVGGSGGRELLWEGVVVANTTVGGGGGRELLWEGVVVFVSGSEWWLMRLDVTYTRDVTGDVPNMLTAPERLLKPRSSSVRDLSWDKLSGIEPKKTNKIRRNVHKGHHW
jgi:hypothetical protein